MYPLTPFSAWLCGSRRRRRPSVAWPTGSGKWREVDSGGSRGPINPSQLNKDVASTVVVARLAALPERQRLAVFLRYWVDLDYRSIAVALDVEVGTVSATLNAAHANLRRSLKEAAP